MLNRPTDDEDVTTLLSVELAVLGPLQVRQHGAPVAIPGAKPRAILTMLGLNRGSVVSAEALVELLWGDDPPRTAAKALQTHISSLRRTLGDGVVVTLGTGWAVTGAEIDAVRYKLAAKMGRDAAVAGDTSQAVARFEEALALWRGIPELPDVRRGLSEKTRWIEGHAALVEDRADALLATGRAAEIIGELEAAVAEAPLRERRWGQLMLALYRAGRQGEALGAFQRARSLLAEELGVDPGPELRRLEAAIVAQDNSLEIPVAQQLSSVTRTVTFLLTDIEGSTAAWEADADAMAVALARHDELVEQVITSRGGRLIKTRGEGDATFSVFDRPSAAASAAIELQEAILHEPWALSGAMRIRVALHTGEAELREGDYFGRAVNRAARLRSLASGGQILCSGATAELVIDSLSDDVVLADLGMRQLKNLARQERVFELRMETADDGLQAPTIDAPMERPGLPAVLVGPGPFVGRGRELERLLSAWQTAVAGGMIAVLIAGEPGVGKSRLAGEWSRQAYEQGAVVLYGRCDEDLGAPYQPFAEAMRSLVPCVGASRLRGIRGVEALLPLVPGLTDVLPDVAAPTRADPDTERYALFDAVVALLRVAATSAPVVLILDDLHWAAKPTLLLLRHVLRFGDHSRVQIVGTYRSTDLDRSHPLAAMLADLHRDGTANRIQLGGLDEDDVTAYVAEAGYDDEDLAHALASVTGGNPFFLIEALRHVDESGGVWDPSTLPQGVREAVSRRLSRLPAETNKALAAAAVVGSRFAVDLVEQVVDEDLVDAFDEACKAGIVIEEPGGHYRFNHAIVRQSLLAELPSVRRMRLHQRIAATLEAQPGADDELLAELAYHYYECAWAGNAVKAVEYCRRAADQAMARLAYEGAADLYDRALHALEEIDDELPDREDQTVELLIARCEALLAAGDVASASGAVSQLQEAAHDSARLAAWATCFDGQLSMLVHPERLDEIERAVGAAAVKLAELDDAAGEAKAHTVRAGCLARLGRIADCEIALDNALTAARRARDHRRVNAVLAGAPLAALWGPNPVPRAGGRCLDVVRLLRITTDSPAVEATSTRCQAVLEAFRGRAAAARRMIDSARRTVTELGLRHAVLEVEHFAGIVELVVDDPVAAEPHLRKAYNGFRRLGLDADIAETAALLGRVCLALDRDAEADELCSESERLAGHALKASIAWRTLRAQLLSRQGDHEEARRIAEEAVSLAERTDALVDHGDACLALATVLGAAGDAASARAAAQRAADLYELKGAAALADKARSFLGERDVPTATPPPEKPAPNLDNACVRAIRRGQAAIDREAWTEVEQLIAPDLVIESRRKIVGFTPDQLSPSEARRLPSESRRLLENGALRLRIAIAAVRGERLALTRLEIGTDDVSPGAPQDELFHLFGLDDDGRIALQVSFDIEDLDAAMAELDAVHAHFDTEQPQVRRVENTASRVLETYLLHFADRDWDAMAEFLAEDFTGDDRRHVVNAGVRHGRDAEIENATTVAALGGTNFTCKAVAIRGERLVLARHFLALSDLPEPFDYEFIDVVEIDDNGRIASHVAFDPDDVDAAFAELDARYLAGEAAAHAHTWSVITGWNAALNRHELPPMTQDCASVDHRRGPAFVPGDLINYLQAGWDDKQDIRTYVEVVHRLSDLGVVCTFAGHGVSEHGFEAEWRAIDIITIDGNLLNSCEIFDEADLDAAIATFEHLHRPEPRLENAAVRVNERLIECLSTQDWATARATLADNFSSDDRRRAVNAGLLHGREAEIANMRAIAHEGVTVSMSDAIAIRGERLLLARARWSVPTQTSEEFHTEILSVVEIDIDERINARVWFDCNDFDAAFAELDARYLAGEAAAYANSWSMTTEAFAALNRHEIPATTPDYVIVDHLLQHTSFEAAGLAEYLSASWDLTPDFRMYVEAVYRLSDLGVVITTVVHGTSHDGLDASWRIVGLLTRKGDLGDRCEVFSEAELDAAIARFEELSVPARPLKNAASRVDERLHAQFAARDWGSAAATIAEDMIYHDRRRVVNAGVRHGRDAEIDNGRALADLGAQVTSTVIATRGQRLVLTRSRFTAPDQRPDAFHNEMLSVLEINDDEQILARVIFDSDDLDAALEELEARYLAGEAAPHARTWSVIAHGYAVANRRQVPATTPDFVNVDHRPLAIIDQGELITYLRNTFDNLTDMCTYVEAAHRLADRGAVITHVGNGTSQEGFYAEWRMISIVMVHGDQMSRTETFADEDIDAALARFDELNIPAPQPKNAASRVCDLYLEELVARDWDATAELLADDYHTDDRRHLVGGGIHDRDAEIANARVGAEIGITHIAPTNIATRGERLVLSRVRYSGRDQGQEAFVIEILALGEINAGNRIAAVVVFDPDDIDAAYEELDARYRAGEATAHAHTWSVITQANAALNRGEMPLTTPNLISLDHRRLATIDSGDLLAHLRATWELTEAFSIYIEAVHRLSDLGAVLTYASCGTSHAGLYAEWRETQIVTVEGDSLSRSEMFDEADLDAALARFDELQRQPPRLQNAASQVYERFWTYYAGRDWDAIAEAMTDDIFSDDRRQVVNAGTRNGRDAVMADMHGLAAIEANITSTVVATRGERLILNRVYSANRNLEHGEFGVEMLDIIEIDGDNRISAGVLFDPDDIDAAFEELDARYLAGEAAAHAQAWSVITGAYAAINRGEIPATTPDWVNIDHQLRTTIEAGNLTAYLCAGWDLTPNFEICVAAVHRLSDLGAVVTHAAHGTSKEGFDAEWRMIALLTADGDGINRCELFDESDIDAAVARFEELHPQARRLENAASQVVERFLAYYAVRDWNAVAHTLSDDVCTDDRRRVVGAAMRRGRDAAVADMRAITDLGRTDISSTVIATRGGHLALTRMRYSGHDRESGAFLSETLSVVETNANDQVAVQVSFDVDDVDAAFEELDARYATGEAAPYAHNWFVIAGNVGAFNRHELPGWTQDVVNIDHRRVTAFPPGDVAAYIHATWEQAPDVRIYIEAVNRLSHIGAVVTHVTSGTSQQGFEAEWRGITISTVEGNLINYSELFDEGDLDAALARFDELDRPTPSLENAAIRTWERVVDAINSHDVDRFLAYAAPGARYEDRRKVLRYEGPARPEVVLALFEITTGWRLAAEPVAVRGSHLGLTRDTYRDTTDPTQPITMEHLTLMEVGDDGLGRNLVLFDPDDLDTALVELDARYLTGEAAEHAHTWSVIMQAYAAMNRHEIPATTPDWVNIDHRRGIAFAAGDAVAYLTARNAGTGSVYVETVHRLSNLGTVFTWAGHGTSPEGFESEWRGINVLTVDGDLINHCALFDEADIDLAIARFDELDQGRSD